MKIKNGLALISVILISCGTETIKTESKPSAKPIQGTWKLITGTLIEKGDTTVTDYTKNTSFIKIMTFYKQYIY